MEPLPSLLDELPKDIPHATSVELPLDTFPCQFPGPKPTPDFVESVKLWGVIEPIVVSVINGHYTVLDGKRRVMAAHAAQAAGRDIDSIKVELWDLSNCGAAAMTLTANAMRSDNPLAEYEAIRDLMDKGYAKAEITKITGYPPARIEMRLRLGGLQPELRAALEAGKISPTAAQAAAKLPESTQSRLTAALAEKGKVSAADVEEAKRVRKARAASAVPQALLTVKPDWRIEVTALIQATIAKIPPGEGHPARAYLEAAAASLDETQDVKEAA